MTTLEFGQKYLFDPLDIRPVKWGRFNQGYYNGSASLKLRPRDMMKIERLYLQNGQYNGNQVLTTEWVAASMQAHIATNNAIPFGPQYGYLWWIGQQNGHDIVFANGYGGQFIVMVPAQNLVVVATSKWRNLGGRANEQWFNVLSVIMNKVLPAVKD